MKKLYYTWQQFDIDISTHSIKILQDPWRPDYIVGITRGGLIPATVLSHRIVKSMMYTLDVRLRDTDEHYAGPENNAWMEEDLSAGKRILLVDDINDSGATFNYIKTAWGEQYFRTNHVRTATLFDHLGSKFGPVNYTINELEPEDKPWVVFPWEMPLCV